MKNFWTEVAVIGIAASLLSGCQSLGPNAAQTGLAGVRDGALVGTVVGALEGKPLEGALIGGATGGALGTAVGDSVDRRNAFAEQQNEAYRQRAIASAISLDQVIQMSQSGVGDAVIANQIRAGGTTARPTPEQIIWLKSQGVSDMVIGALQSASPAGQVPPAAPASTPTRVEYVVPDYGPGVFYGPGYVGPRYVGPGCWGPPPYRPRWHHGHHHCRPHRRGWTGVSVHF